MILQLLTVLPQTISGLVVDSGMKFPVLFMLIIFSSLLKAGDGMQWIFVAEFPLTDQKTHVYKFENNPVELDIQIRRGDRVVFSQSTIENRNSIEYSVIDNRDYSENEGQLQIYIRAKHTTNDLPTIDVNEIELFTIQELDYYKIMHSVSELWYESTATQKELAFELLDESTILVANKLSAEKELKKSWILMSLEKYDEAWLSLVSDSNLLFDSWDLRLKKSWLQALVLIQNGQFTMASEVLTLALNEFNQAPIELRSWQLLQAEIQSSFGLSQALNSYYNKSTILGLQAINQALNNASQLGDPVLIAKILYHLASYYSAQQQWQQAIATLKVALDYSLSSKSVTERYVLYNQLGFAYKKLNNLNLAMQNYRLALDLLTNSNSQQQSRASIQLNLALIYEILGDYERAIRYFNQSKAVFDTLGNENFSAFIDNALGRIERENSRIESAISYHTQSLQYFVLHSVRLLMESLLELSLDYLASENHLLAENYLLKVMAFDLLFTDEDSQYNQNYSAQSFLQLLATKSNEELQQMIAASSQSENKSAGSLITIQAQLYLAASYYSQSQWNSFKKYMDILIENNQDQSLQKSLQLVDLLNFYDLQMRYYLHYSFDQDYENTAKKALKLVADKNSQIEIPEQALKWNQKSISVITSYADWLIARGAYTDVFALLEKYYALNLRAEKQAKQDLNIKEMSLELSQALKDYVSSERQSQLQGHLEAQNKTDEAQEHFLALAKHEIKQDSSYKSTELSLRQVQERLNAGDLLLRYFINDKTSMLFAVDNKGYEIFDLPSNKQIQAIVDSSLQAIKSKRYNSLSEPAVLPSTLIPLKLIKQQQYKKLIIIADDVLHVFPFSAINISGQEGEYLPLITQLDIERSYSASDYLALSNTKKSTVPSISIFSNPTFLKTQIKPADIEKGSKLWTFSPLPNTAKEANYIQQIFPDFNFNLMAAQSATNKAFLSEKNRNASILHIATHGIFNENNLNSAGLATSVVNTKGQQSEGFLSLNEMLFYSFEARLAVISGCETTRGKAIKGEGYISLTRGLLSQGVASVIGTIWSISDKATPEFMKLFYTELKNTKGNSSKALSASQRLFAQNGRYRHPYYWAGFVLTSSNRSISEHVF